MKLFCVLALFGALLCNGVQSSNIETFGNSSLIEAFALKYAPRLRFDSAATANGKYCLPGSASDYYDLRMKDNTGRICNSDYSTVQAGKVPTYWHAQVCGYHLHIAYWSFYGYNDNCDCCSGRRNAWFESVVVKVRDYQLPGAKMHSVRFSQKNGWYTRVPGHYEQLPSGRPVAYVGKGSHGHYHDDGGSGTCCYFEDYRDPRSEDMHMDTWLNLVAFDNTTAWMNDNRTGQWSGIHAPPHRGDWDLCKLNGCTGASVQLCTVSGCVKSDTGDAPF